MSKFNYTELNINLQNIIGMDEIIEQIELRFVNI